MASASLDASLIDAFVVDVDLCAGNFNDFADDLTTGTDHFADFIRWDLHGFDLGCVHAQNRWRPVRALPISPRMCRRPALACSRALAMISGVMPAILMSICKDVMPCFGACNLKVHVAKVIFVAEDVGQDGVVAVVFHHDP